MRPVHSPCVPVSYTHLPQAIFRSSKSELESAGLSAGVAQSIASGCAFEEAADQHAKLLSAGAELISINDARYPPRLREIYDLSLIHI